MPCGVYISVGIITHGVLAVKPISKQMVYLDYLDDSVFDKFIKRCRSQRINLRTIRSITKHLNPNTFNEEAIFYFIERRKDFPKRGCCYIPEYIALRNNISVEEAVGVISSFKSNKATSREGFIKRYGEQEGEKRFSKFLETSKYSTSNEWFKSKYGADWEHQKLAKKKVASRWCVEYWIARGQSIEEAKKSVSDYQKNNAGVSRQYWENLGLSSDEVDIIIGRISQLKGYTKRNREKWRDKYGNEWKEKYNQYRREYRENMESLGLWIAADLKSEWEKYHQLCWSYTRDSLHEYDLPNIEQRSREWHLDHKYSIKQGFIDDIDPKIIGSIVNLEIIPKLENLSKKEKCSITIEDLLQRYGEYENQEDNTSC